MVVDGGEGRDLEGKIMGRKKEGQERKAARKEGKKRRSGN